MRAGQQHVDAEASIGIGTAEKEETRVHDERDVGIFRERAANLRQRIHHAGGGFVMNESDGVELSGREFRVDRLVIDRLPPLHLERLGLLAATPGDIEPFVGKRAAHAAEDAVALTRLRIGRFHHAPGGRGGKKNRLLRAEQCLQARMNLAVEILEILAAMADHRPRKSRERFFRNLDRAGNEEFVVRNHGQILTAKSKCANASRSHSSRLTNEADVTAALDARDFDVVDSFDVRAEAQIFLEIVF